MVSIVLHDEVASPVERLDATDTFWGETTMSNSTNNLIATSLGKDGTGARVVHHAWQIFFLVLASAQMLGCYDAKALISSRQEIAIRTRLEEVDLGEFQVSLPRPVEKAESPEIHIHVFGQVANRDLDTVEDALDKHGPEIRHQLLLVTRQLTAQELEDPLLTSLRTNIVSVVNKMLPGEPLQSVGFYRLTLSNL